MSCETSAQGSLRPGTQRLLARPAQREVQCRVARVVGSTAEHGHHRVDQSAERAPDEAQDTTLAVISTAIASGVRRAETQSSLEEVDDSAQESAGAAASARISRRIIASGNHWHHIARYLIVVGKVELTSRRLPLHTRTRSTTD